MMDSCQGWIRKIDLDNTSVIVAPGMACRPIVDKSARQVRPRV
jgi:hypothetical protein